MTINSDERLVRRSSNAPAVPPPHAVVRPTLAVQPTSAHSALLPAQSSDVIATSASCRRGPTHQSQVTVGELEGEVQPAGLRAATPLPSSPHPSKWPGPTPSPPPPHPTAAPTLPEFQARETRIIPLPCPTEPFDPSAWADVPGNHLGRRLGSLPFPAGASWTSISRFARQPQKVVYFDRRITLANVIEWESTLVWAAIRLPPRPTPSSAPSAPQKNAKQAGAKANGKGKAAPAPSDEVLEAPVVGEAGTSAAAGGKGKAREDPVDLSNAGERAMLAPFMLEVGCGCIRCIRAGVVCIRIFPHSCLCCVDKGQTCSFSREDPTTRETVAVPHGYVEFVTPRLGWVDPRVPNKITPALLQPFLSLLRLANRGTAPTDLTGSNNVLASGRATLPVSRPFPVETRWKFAKMIEFWFGILYRGDPPRTSLKRKRPAAPAADEPDVSRVTRRKSIREASPATSDSSSQSLFTGQSAPRPAVVPASDSMDIDSKPAAGPSGSSRRSRSSTLVAPSLPPRMQLRSASRASPAQPLAHPPVDHVLYQPALPPSAPSRPLPHRDNEGREVTPGRWYYGPRHPRMQTSDRVRAPPLPPSRSPSTDANEDGPDDVDDARSVTPPERPYARSHPRMIAGNYRRVLGPTSGEDEQDRDYPDDLRSVTPGERPYARSHPRMIPGNFHQAGPSSASASRASDDEQDASDHAARRPSPSSGPRFVRSSVAPSMTPLPPANPSVDLPPPPPVVRAPVRGFVPRPPSRRSASASPGPPFIRSSVTPSMTPLSPAGPSVELPPPLPVVRAPVRAFVPRPPSRRSASASRVAPFIRSSVTPSMTPLSPAGPSVELPPPPPVVRAPIPDPVPCPPSRRSASASPGPPVTRPSLSPSQTPLSPAGPSVDLAPPPPVVREPPANSVPRAPSRPASPTRTPRVSSAGLSHPRRRQPYTRSAHLTALLDALVPSHPSGSSLAPAVAHSVPVNHSSRRHFSRCWGSHQVMLARANQMGQLLLTPLEERPDDWEEQLSDIQFTMSSELAIQRIDLSAVSTIFDMELIDASHEDLL